MSDLHASITCYDFMSDVYVGVRVFDCRSTDSAHSAVLATQETFPGEGQDDPREWLRDCLITLLEAL